MSFNSTPSHSKMSLSCLVMEDIKDLKGKKKRRGRIVRRIRGSGKSLEKVSSSLSRSRSSSSISLNSVKMISPVYDLEDNSLPKSTMKATSTSYLEEKVMDHKLVLPRETSSIEVIGEGTKLMKSISFPTVIIKTRMTNLQSCTVYYVTLGLESKEFVGKIPTLMFSSPYCLSGRTEYAELLPLRVKRDKQNPEFIALRPMLTSSRYKGVFRKGCSFQINSLEKGRTTNSSCKDPWNSRNSTIKEVREKLADIIYDDIGQIPKAMARKLKPLRRIKAYNYRLSKSSVADRAANLLQGQSGCKLSDYCNNLKFPGLTASGGSSFAAWFEALPPNVHVDQNFTCDHGTTLTRDLFSDRNVLDQYLCISEEL